MGRIYSVDLQFEPENHAGVKAPTDISRICHDMGMISFPFPVQKYMFPQGLDKLRSRIWLLKTCGERWNALRRTVRQDDIVFYQHPLYGARAALRYIPLIKREKGCRFIALIHDLESLRMGIGGLYEKSRRTAQLSDQQLLRQFDMVICHNEHMRQYLIRQGFAPEKLVNLEIFDYLTDAVMHNPEKCSCPTLAVAGNLHPGKSGYLYEMFRGGQGGDDLAGRSAAHLPEKSEGLCVNAYGANFDGTLAAQGIHYRGSFPAEQLPGELRGDFGLVWDGPSAETCTGNTGAYLKYNNPHKASLYLASGLPVMIWKEAAMADFITRNQAGVTIGSLTEAEDVIRNMTEAEYGDLCGQAARIGQQLRQGTYFRRAFQECLDRLNGKPAAQKFC